MSSLAERMSIYRSLIISLLAVSPIHTLAQIAPSSQWTLLNSSSAPGHIDGPAFAYDIESQRVIMFGSHGQDLYTNSTWAYDVVTDVWTRQSPLLSPSPRGHSAMAYDSVSDRMILFGGQLQGNLPNGETWTYNFNDDTWTNVNPSGAVPAARWGHALAYDSESDRTLMFGGFWFLENVTWAYDDATNTWENRDLTMSAACFDQRPPAKHLHAMAYIPAPVDRVLMTGYDARFLMQTWAYDYNSNCWSLRGTTGQPTGDAFSMVYNAHGGEAVSTGDDNTTWTYNYSSNTWTNRTISPRPTVHHHGMAYVPFQNRTILYGGRNANGAIETWQHTMAGPSPPAPPTNLRIIR